MAFEENKHLRDKDGKFTKGTDYRQNTSYDEIRKNNDKNYKISEEVYGFANKERLNTKDHIQHAKDMGFKNQKEYERFACEFWNTKRGILYYSNRRKRYYRYEENTNLLCVVSNGIIHTFMYVSKNKFIKMLEQEKLCKI